jgi:hypothetical protein
MLYLSIFWHAFAEVSDRGKDLQIETGTANTIYKHYEVAEKVSSTNLGVDRGADAPLPLQASML